jgi:Phosphoribosyl-AMP cyclohydrolase
VWNRVFHRQADSRFAKRAARKSHCKAGNFWGNRGWLAARAERLALPGCAACADRTNHSMRAVSLPRIKRMSTTPSTTGPDFTRNGGLLPAIAQDATTGEVLMVAWMNAEAYGETVRTGQAVYFSRSRGKLWRKGEESGHTQTVRAIYVDCDADAILLKVEQVGAACHEGYRSCFFRQVTPEGLAIVAERLVDPASVYRSG